jgi:CDP-glucose 4,6-dehydratase
MMFGDAYKSRKVLITGHTGFKGSWLSIWLRELGADVVGYSLEAPSQPNNFSASALASRMTHIRGDILDTDRLKAVFAKHRPEIVFHLAAQAIVRESYANPSETFHVNVAGTVNLLERVRLDPRVKAVVCVTSDKCYEPRESIEGYREIDPMGGKDPYSASKGCAELVFSSYLSSFFGRDRSGKESIGAVSVRGGNAIGGGDWGKDRLVPDCVRELDAGRSIGIRNPMASRPWQHILDLLSGYLWIGSLIRQFPGPYSGSWNFGPTEDGVLTVRDVVERLIKSWGSGSWTDLSNPHEPHEAPHLKLCVDKARNRLGWRSVLSADEAIAMTARWYQRYYRSRDRQGMYGACVEQIQTYAKKAQQCGLSWTKKS